MLIRFKLFLIRYAELFSLEKALERKIRKLEEDKKQWEKKLGLAKQQMKDTEEKSKFYLQINQALEKNQEDWQSKVKETETKLKNTYDEKDLRIQELEEQIKDLMFFIENREKIEKDPDMKEGELILKPSPNLNTPTTPKKKPPTSKKPTKKNKKR